jgi:DNA-binding transcriptional LysR family regulator
MVQRYPGAPRRKRPRSLRSITRADGWAQDRDFDFWPPRWDHGAMELRHLRTIAAVARHGSFTKAAEELYLAQSAISQQIRRLEAELGVEVFRRTSRRVELTAEGRVILGYAQRVLAEVDGLQSELEELTGLLRGQLRIGGVYPTGPYDLFGMLADFRAAHPGVAIHMVEDTQDGVLAALEADELDCAFSALNPDTLGNEFAATLLWEDEIVVAVPLGHRLGARKQVTFEELAAEDLIAYRENSALRRRLERTMAERGLEPRNAFICTEMGAVRGLASKGLGVAVIPRSVAEQPGPPIELRPIAPEPLTWPVALVWRAARRQTPAGKAFLKVALDYAENTEPAVLRAA